MDVLSITEEMQNSAIIVIVADLSNGGINPRRRDKILNNTIEDAKRVLFSSTCPDVQSLGVDIAQESFRRIFFCSIEFQPKRA